MKGKKKEIGKMIKEKAINIENKVKKAEKGIGKIEKVVVKEAKVVGKKIGKEVKIIEEKIEKEAKIIKGKIEEKIEGMKKPEALRTDFNSIEKKWQKAWEEKKIFEVSEDGKKKKFYNLEMFPYPSGSGLHMGHALNYTIGDIYARFKRMNGFNVLYPMGYDAFGLPAENAAIKAGEHPKGYTKKSMQNFEMQQKALGLSYDWSRKVVTCNPEYYKWNQYFFLKFFEAGLVERRKSAVNWCPKCETVLANEQVHSGKCWRHEDTDVEIKHLEQWFIKTTKYSEEILNKVRELKWPERIKLMQENWIGKSYGTEIDFEIDNKNKKKILIGTRNKAKIAMIKRAFADFQEIEFVSLEDFPKLDDSSLKEGNDFKENAHIKSEFYFRKTGIPTISTDQIQWVEKHDKDNGFIIHIRKLANPKSERATDEEVGKWIEDLVKKKGNSKGTFYYGISYTDKNGTKDFVNVQKEYILGKEKSPKINDGYIFDRYMKDPKTGEFRIDQPEEVAFSKFHDFVREEFIPKIFPEIKKWKIFTTRPDTIYGVTFMVVSAQHSRLFELVTEKQKKEVEAFLKRLKSVSEKEQGRASSDESEEPMEKDGVFTGSYAINPLTGDKIPVWVGNFVVADYGSGMVMAVPAHDQRDWEFAKKYEIEMKEVIKGGNIKKEAYTDEGVLVNSEKFNGVNSKEAIEKITTYLESKKIGRKTINYKFRDWLVSRQRYWGTPIPMIYCNKCGIVPVPEKELPVELPEKVKFGEGNPLAFAKEWINVKCPKCGEKARRETDTMDTFFDSSWYFLRYADNKNSKNAFDSKKVEYWMPVDQYIGGAEHACMHLIYARFFVKALRDLGMLDFDEPFLKLFNQGMLHGSDGNKMSKSLGNVVNPIEMIEKYSADSLRFNLMTLASPDKDSVWSNDGLESSFRFLNRIYNYFEKVKIGKSSEIIISKYNKAVKEITSDIESFNYNLAIIKLRSLFESFGGEESKEVLEGFVKMIAPICPHIGEEIWHNLGNRSFVSLEAWPQADEKKINEKLEQQEKNVEKTVSDVQNIFRIIKERENKEAKKVYLYVIPPELNSYRETKEMMEKVLNVEVFVYAVNDARKHDPEGKAGKAKMGKPAIFVE